MNRLQRSFYQKHYRPQFEAGIALDIEGQYGYPTVVLHDLLERWPDEPELVMEGMRRLLEAYRRTSVSASARWCLADMHLLRGEWAEAVEQLGGRRGLTVVVGAGALVHPRVDSWSVLDWGTPSITKPGLKNLDAAMDDLQAVLDGFHDENGMSIVEWFWGRLWADEPLDGLAASIQQAVGSTYDVEDIAHLIRQGREFPPMELVAFEGFGRHERPIPAPWPWMNAWAFYGLWRALFRRLFRESENRAREGAGLPRVGEGRHVSELLLLNQLRKAFPNEGIEHQARPWWLTPQSLDMMFVGRNVAVEYQGVQHSKPVDLFGGKEKFVQQQLRDSNKRYLCEQNGMHLIEVHPDYRLSDVVAEVQTALDAQAARETVKE